MSAVKLPCMDQCGIGVHTNYCPAHYQAIVDAEIARLRGKLEVAKKFVANHLHWQILPSFLAAIEEDKYDSEDRKELEILRLSESLDVHKKMLADCRTAIAAAVQAEREACAELATKLAEYGTPGDAIAAMIRNRQPKEAERGK
jgi:hypothetical protein